MSVMTGHRLQDQYTILGQLGAGGSGQSYLARDDSGQKFAIKTLHLGQVEDWKFIQLFERQFDVLKHLEHPSIPRVFAIFSQEIERVPRQFLVQEYIEGENLKALLDSGHRFKEEEARRLLVEMLDILEYLHTFSPPILHRDIKPSNIILRATDGSAVLIDFDTARLSAVDASMADGTMVGTAGYVALDQLSGRPTPSSDLYALGMTLIRALSGKDPTDLPVESMRTQFRPFLNVSENLLDTIELMIEPDVSDRAQSVADVRRALVGEPSTALTKPAPTAMTEQIGPDNLPQGQEVMVPLRSVMRDEHLHHDPGYTICTVCGQSSRHEHILVERKDGERVDVPKSEVIAVTREGIGARTQVYRRKQMSMAWQMDEWELTWTTSISGATALVKSSNPSFQHSVFDDQVNLIDLRQPLFLEQRHQRSIVGATLVRFKSDPVGAFFSVLFTCIFLIMFGAIAVVVLSGLFL